MAVIIEERDKKATLLIIIKIFVSSFSFYQTLFLFIPRDSFLVRRAFWLHTMEVFPLELQLFTAEKIAASSSRGLFEGEKNHKKGGLNCVFENFFLTFWKTVLRFRVWNSSESEWVQSLSAADKWKEQRKKEHKQLYRFLPQTGSSPVPLALPRRVPLKCNVKLQVAQSHKKETSQCSRTTPRDFYAQSHLNETSMLKENSKRLRLLSHNWKWLNLTITKNWIRFWILDIQSEVFTIQYETEQTLFF